MRSKRAMKREHQNPGGVLELYHRHFEIRNKIAKHFKKDKANNFIPKCTNLRPVWSPIIIKAKIIIEKLWSLKLS
jgi:hypothetical protein